MLNIRRLGLFDKRKIKGIIKANGSDGDFKYPILKELCCFVQTFLPLKMKLMSETFVCTDNGDLKGVISVKPVRGNSNRINILQLIFANNDYTTGKELVNFVVKHYGKLGATVFKVVINDEQKNLEDLFMHGCGFRCGSWENLWDLTPDLGRFKEFKNVNYSQMTDSYASQVADLINSEVLSHYKPALLRNANEFKPPVVELFSNTNKSTYVKHFGKNICAYFSIRTSDNKNFVLIPYINSGYEISYDEIIAFAVKNISKFRTSDFNLYLCQQKNLKFSEDLEKYLHSNNYKCVNTSHVLIKEFYTPVKQEYQSFVFSENGLVANR